MTHTFTQNETTYTTTEFMVSNTSYSCTIVKGKFNYVNVVKNDVRRSLGKDFKNFDEAISYYKNPTIKTKLLQIELGLI